MKIVGSTTVKQLTFGELQPDTVFTNHIPNCKPQTYLKTNTLTSIPINAVALEGGFLAFFSDDSVIDAVYPNAIVKLT
jgi:hypothetical protein